MSAAASVRVSGPPNSSFLVGYPGISATLVRRRVAVLVLHWAFGLDSRSSPDADIAVL